MPQTPRRRRTAPVGALVPAPLVQALLVPALLTLLLTGCMADPAEIPGDAQEPSAPSATAPADGGADGTAPSAAPDDPESTDVGAAVARRITDCLARYGLSERPVLPDDVSEEELVAARRLIEQYDQTFTTCTAEALAASATAP
ncbi:hypothetical protein [Rathayibacter sp. Leaf248]|uniref:hypothetical protein n=1 Tax=Rathayibacter sp. Leaf248 TaxID=2876555 RepID=UPI001E49C86D|nr:hypothetical protein [Rathayibacter sp. Leaf248]